ncbi:CsbD family protein [Tomitella biformata]|uniref:CsbD family protein n=1 Tax=Tomitella biformata TaxID=630403 RepID=UPI000464F98D|nr:CsbD family protein [Tomitella biformata]
MGIKDKFENKAEELKGRAKESAGAATGDADLENEGKADQVSSGVKKAAETVKDKANEIAAKIAGDN